MCIMEVREGQRSATIAMAVAHNCSTSDRDLDMFEILLAKRGEYNCLAIVHSAHERINRAYQELLQAYAAEVSGVIPAQDNHEHVGNERFTADAAGTIEEIADRDARRARRFETR